MQPSAHTVHTARSDAGRMSLGDRFLCRSRRRWVLLENCLDDYVDANSLEKRRSACFRCPHGHTRRDAYAASGQSD
jgi:hypothetical protein